MIQETSPPPTHFSEVATPGLMLSNAWPVSRETEGATEAAIHEALAETSFFEALQIVDVPYPEERERITAFLKKTGKPMTYTLTRYLAKNGINLGDLNPESRKRGWEEAISKIREALDLGATTVGLVSGPRPEDPNKRQDALAALGESLTEICRAAGEMGDIRILVEPLDYNTHKKCTLGTIEEGVALCRRVEKAGAALSLCLDTAHMVLNGESVPEAAKLADDYIEEFHFCNCVLDRSLEAFGDRHLPFGPPGEVDKHSVGRWMAALYRQGFLSPTRRPKVFCEVLPHGEMTSLDVVRHCQDTLRGGWDIAREELAGDLGV